MRELREEIDAQSARHVEAPPARLSVPARTRRRLADLVAVTATLAATYVLVGASCGWTRVFSSTPLRQDGDAAFYLALARTIGQTGWWTSTTRLGYPNGQVNYDFPLGGDTQSILLLRLIRVVTTEPGQMTNLFYLWTFLAAALSAFVVLRCLHCRAITSIPIAVAFAVSPYHFARSESHLLLSAYWTVPIAIFVLLRADRVIPWLREGQPARGVRRLLRPMSLLLVTAILAGNGFYYAFFFLFGLSLVTLGRIVAGKDIRAIFGPLIVASFVGGFISLFLLPSFLYEVQHGPNYAPINRMYTEQEFYGLRLVELVTPSGFNHIPVLSRLGDTVNQGFGGERGTSHLGALATMGLVALMVISLLTFFERRTASRFSARPDLRVLSFLTVVFILFAVPAGFGALVSLGELKVIRAWNRVSVVIAFTSLTTLGMLLDSATSSTAFARWRSRRLVRFGGPVMVLFVMMGVYFDQVPDLHTTGRATAHEFNGYQQMTRDVSRMFGDDARVFTWPIVRYPASPPAGSVEAYDSLLLYAYSSRLRLSAGAMMGRPEDWTEPLTSQPADRLIRSAALAGFDAFLVDRRGFTSAVAEEQFEAAAVDLVGPPVLSDNSNTRVVFDLRPLRASQADSIPPDLAATASERLVRPVVATFGGHAYAAEPSIDGFTRWLGTSSSLVLSNPWTTERYVRVQMSLTAPATPSATLEITGALTRTVTLGRNPTDIVLEVPVEAGSDARLSFATNAGPVVAPGDPRDIHLRVTHGLVSDAVVEEALSIG
jgi:hypothetical protein